MKISLYKNIKSTTPFIASKCIFKVLDDIKNGTYKKQIANVRLEIDKDKKKIIKNELENVTFSGTFTTRANSNLKQFSGIACLDFDNVEDLETLIEKVNNDSYTFSSFISPSGNGLKVLVKIPLVDNNEDYQDYYTELTKHFSKYHILDTGTKDLARATFVSYDSNLFLNIESKLFTEKFNRPLPIVKSVVNVPLNDSNEIADRLEKWFSKRWTSVNRNNNLHAYARQMNVFGVEQSVCESYLLRYGDSNTESEILKLINSAYKYSSEHRTQFFEDTVTVQKVKNLVLSGENIESIKNKVNLNDLQKLEDEVNKHKEDLKTDEFWYYTDKNHIKLASFRFLTYLESNNIFKFYPDENSGAFIFVKNENNFLSVFDENKIKDFCLNDLRARGVIDAFELMADNSQAFNHRYLSMIKTVNVTFNRDTEKESFIYYNNFAVKTTKDKIELLKYDEISDMIWKNQVVKRDIVLKDESDGVFKSFIWKISGENPDRYYTLKSVIGYLMHSYQNDAKPKAIIFNDEMISEDVPNGGSGKGLIHRAISQIKNLVIEDGKKFDPRSQFAYQKVNKDTQIFLMDDVPKSFNFESLFSIVTEGMTVEKKGKDAYQIAFKESPKISITTNYTVKGSGASFFRRVFEVEIANYFNDSHTPEDEFKHQFFSGWNELEYQNFDNFMIRCIQFYLKNGLLESNKVNLDLRKIVDELGSEFIEFMEMKTFDGTPINRKDFRDEFNKNYPTSGKFNTPQKFNNKVKRYCNFHNIVFEEGKYNGTIMFYIGEINTTSDEMPF